MGTNYYLFSDKKQFKEEFEGAVELTDTPDFGYTVHLCKFSCMWRPLFQANNVFKTYRGFEQYLDRNKLVPIIDEYGKVYTHTEFKNELFEKLSMPTYYSKWVFDTDHFGSQPYCHTVMCEEAENEITCPYSHKEYQDGYAEALKRFGQRDKLYINIEYIEDPDVAVDWVNEDFS